MCRAAWGRSRAGRRGYPREKRTLSDARGESRRRSSRPAPMATRPGRDGPREIPRGRPRTFAWPGDAAQAPGPRSPPAQLFGPRPAPRQSPRAVAAFATQGRVAASAGGAGPRREGRGHAGRGGARPGQRRGTFSAEPASRGALAFAPRTPSPARPCAPRPVPAAFCAEQGTRRLAGGAAPLPPAAGPGQPAAWLVAVRTGPPGTAQAFGGAGLAYTKQVPTLPFMCICQKVLMYELGGHVHKCLYSTF